jgi:hypothetical protein
MRIEIRSLNPTQLLANIFEKTETDVLKTWEIRKYSNEKYLTHKGQWLDEALLKFSIKNDENRLHVSISWLTNNEMPKKITKGIYLGRFSEALLNHFSEEFSSFETFYK